jgi:predicted RNA-binding Zn-ribbon protein involved in translation (DUF1610 family)
MICLRIMPVRAVGQKIGHADCLVCGTHVSLDLANRVQFPCPGCGLMMVLTDHCLVGAGDTE